MALRLHYNGQHELLGRLMGPDTAGAVYEVTKTSYDFIGIRTTVVLKPVSPNDPRSYHTDEHGQAYVIPEGSK